MRRPLRMVISAVVILICRGNGWIWRNHFRCLY